MTLPADKPLGCGIRPSENRRASKPLMEKKRRARINKSLCELKSLILDTVKQDAQGPRHSKLEKADILEMAVKHLQSLQCQDKKEVPTSKFRAGFAECTREVTQYFSNNTDMDPTLKSRLLSHLNDCLSSMEEAKDEEEEGKEDIAQTKSSPTKESKTLQEVTSGMVPLIISRLSNGQLALVMPDRCRCLPVIPLDLSNRQRHISDFCLPNYSPDMIGLHKLNNQSSALVWRPW